MAVDIRVTEEALLNSIPALQTVLLDGWVLRFNRNYTYRANCVCPLRYEAGEECAAKVAACEKLFAANGIPPVFKVTPVLQPGLAVLLLARGYRNVKTVKVMGCPLPETAASRPEILCAGEPDGAWLAASARLTGVTRPELAEIHCRGLRSIAVESVFVQAAADGKIVGCGYGTAERGLVGVYDLHVDAAYRRRGLGTAICREIFRFGAAHGARDAYLIVFGKNENAIALYSRMGFGTLYEYGFYQRPGGPAQIVDA